MEMDVKLCFIYFLGSLDTTHSLLSLQTPAHHGDIECITKATEVVEKIITKVDKQTGHAKCQFTKEMLEYLDDKQVYIHSIVPLF